jgi:hypothetical protein
MSQNPTVAHRNIFVRCLTAVALVAICLFGAATVGSTSADARGRGRGFYGGRGRGWGRGYGYGFYAAPVYVAPRGCYWSRRWQRRICPYY